MHFGHPAILRRQDTLQWPFPRGRRYKIIQAYNGSFSHNSDFSRYAIDFDLAIGDTVCAAADGLVMEVIQGYDIGGNSRDYRPYANFITILHADGYLTQYVHLKHKGALVQAGDRVKTGQAVGLSGQTGFTSTPHLHFNVLKPIFRDVVSTPCQFANMAGKELRRGQVVGH
jgi:murein DD-endopeptidase MepM/ murein hydrolase activator NlpD